MSFPQQRHSAYASPLDDRQLCYTCLNSPESIQLETPIQIHAFLAYNGWRRRSKEIYRKCHAYDRVRHEDTPVIDFVYRKSRTPANCRTLVDWHHSHVPFLRLFPVSPDCIASRWPWLLCNVPSRLSYSLYQGDIVSFEHDAACEYGQKIAKISQTLSDERVRSVD